jgi:hypothetical protein
VNGDGKMAKKQTYMRKSDKKYPDPFGCSASNWVLTAYPIIPGKKLPTGPPLKRLKKRFTHKSANKPEWIKKAGG